MATALPACQKTVAKGSLPVATLVIRNVARFADCGVPLINL